MYLEQLLSEKEYLPIPGTRGGGKVTAEAWSSGVGEMKSLLETYSYGISPEKPDKVYGEIISRSGAGEWTEEKAEISFENGGKRFSFPAELFIPADTDKPPVILHIAFRPVPDRYIPVEQIIKAGYALAVVVYTDMMNDNHFGDFSGGIAEHFGTSSDRKPDEWGKIGMWAYGASRLLDYLLTREDIDASRTAVIGHSRLGKTALWCAALDERFAAAVSNDSGYGGAASSKHGTGERVTDFLKAGSWDWYCENFKLFTDEKEDSKPYDQSFLLAMISPRYLCVGSASMDKGADPVSEFLTTLHASQAWEITGHKGLITPDRLPVPGDELFEGDVGYHLREGEHSLKPEDWQAYIRFLDMKFKKI